MTSSPPKHPILFQEFFQFGLPESSSPFLTRSSRRWGINLPLKASLAAGFLLASAFVLHFFPHMVPLSHFLLLFVYFLAGIPSLIESIEDLLNLEVNIDVLMTLAAFSSIFIDSAMEGGLLLVLFAISGSIEEAVTRKAEGSISNLNKLCPSKAWVIDSKGTMLERAVQDISVGMQILVKSGETVPLDGRVLKGTSSVNLVHLTGENLPVIKKEGDEVPAGARNLEEALVLEVTHTSADSAVARIIQLVTQAQEARPRLQRWFDSLSERYAIAIILFSVCVALFLPIIIPIPYLSFEGSIYRALAFLIAASPCALIIAIPIAYLSAISVCARKGILLKGGVTLDALASCSTIAFDKTGTLTTGNLTCIAMESLTPMTEKEEREALSVALELEKNVVHPIATAIIDFASDKEIVPVQIKNFRSFPGYGLEAMAVVGHQSLPVVLGHADYITEKLPEIEKAPLIEKIHAVQAKGELLTLLLMGPHVIIFRFGDTLRPKAKETITALNEEKRWRLLMLTGDHENSAKSIADKVGISEYYANLRPEDKLRYVTQLAANGLAMVGDGINDAPALARATVGICMGQVGSATAMDAANVILLQDNLEQLSWLMKKARATQTIVRQNLFTAVAAIFLASIPALMGWIPLWLAVVAHEGGTVAVGLNALRLLKKS
jgi:heavy metal translocating P-type ATPase